MLLAVGNLIICYDKLMNIYKNQKDFGSLKVYANKNDDLCDVVAGLRGEICEFDSRWNFRMICKLFVPSLSVARWYSEFLIPSNQRIVVCGQDYVCVIFMFFFVIVHFCCLHVVTEISFMHLLNLLRIVTQIRQFISSSIKNFLRTC